MHKNWEKEAKQGAPGSDNARGAWTQGKAESITGKAEQLSRQGTEANQTRGGKLETGLLNHYRDLPVQERQDCDIKSEWSTLRHDDPVRSSSRHCINAYYR